MKTTCATRTWTNAKSTHQLDATPFGESPVRPRGLHRTTLRPVLKTIPQTLLISVLLLPAIAVGAAACGPVTDAQTARDLGRKVLAIDQAIRNPGAPGSMQAILDLGLDQRYYTMVRGWLSYQLQGDISILNASQEKIPAALRARIHFLEQAIRAIDLE